MTEQMKEAIIKARKEVKEETDLKKRASLAKERLKMGYWTQLAVERADFLKREGDTPENRMKIQTIQRSRFIRENLDCVEGDEISETEKTVFTRMLYSR
ncbi:MAG: hypothetical protein KH405_05505 [Firmicutes bacterium]|nr:hypothetical protein [Bacillota bacterium]